MGTKNVAEVFETNTFVTGLFIKKKLTFADLRLIIRIRFYYSLSEIVFIKWSNQIIRSVENHWKY